MNQVEFEQHLGKQNICPHITEALKRATAIHEELAESKGLFAVKTP